MFCRGQKYLSDHGCGPRVVQHIGCRRSHVISVKLTSQQRSQTAVIDSGRYPNYLIFRFMNIKENMRENNKENEEGVPTKLPIFRLLPILVYLNLKPN